MLYTVLSSVADPKLLFRIRIRILPGGSFRFRIRIRILPSDLFGSGSGSLTEIFTVLILLLAFTVLYWYWRLEYYIVTGYFYIITCDSYIITGDYYIITGDYYIIIGDITILKVKVFRIRIFCFVSFSCIYLFVDFIGHIYHHKT